MLQRRVQTPREHFFHIRPVLLDDGKPCAVAAGAIRHDVVVAEGAFVDGADRADCCFGTLVVVVGLEGYAEQAERFKGVGELQ